MRILKRDARGWIARVRCEKGTGGLHGWSTLNPETPRNRPQDGDFSQGELPKSEFGVHKLLDTVNLPADYPTAPAPACLQTKPKPFQLQVEYRACAQASWNTLTFCWCTYTPGCTA